MFGEKNRNGLEKTCLGMLILNSPDYSGAKSREKNLREQNFWEQNFRERILRGKMGAKPPGAKSPPRSKTSGSETSVYRLYLVVQLLYLHIFILMHISYMYP